MKFNITCQVSGGITGTRQALLKSDGIVKEFDSREDAQKETDRLIKNVSPYSQASFQYWVVEKINTGFQEIQK